MGVTPQFATAAASFLVDGRAAELRVDGDA